MIGSSLQAKDLDFCGVANFPTRTDSGVTLTADFLYWYPSEEVSSIWASVISVGFDTSSWGAPGFNFSWDPGFRLGGGYDLAYDQWDTAFYWTWFRTDAVNIIPSQLNTTISPEFDAAFLTGNFAQSLKGRWSLLLNLFDWELGRNYWVSEHLSLRPFLGVKGGWIHQSIRADYYDLTINHALTNNSGKEHLKNNFWGVGTQGGVNTKWNIHTTASHFFSLFGDFCMATLWGNWTCTDVYQNTASQIYSIDTDKAALGALMFRGFAGIGWDIGCCPSGSHFSAKLGFETQIWFNQLRISTLQVQRLHGDLTLQGLTFNCRYDY